MPPEERSYREWVKPSGLVAFEVAERETDLQILATSDLSAAAEAAVEACRDAIEKHILGDPGFMTAERPVSVCEMASEIVHRMVKAGRLAGTGPMAAVAGAVAEFVGRELMASSPEVIVENGGDIFMASASDRTVAIYAGDSPLSGKVGIRIAAARTPLGICTSSGTVGHSKSYGRADAAVALSADTALADAVATAAGNRVKSAGDLEPAVEWATSIDGITGGLIVLDDKMAAAGDVELVKL